MTEKRFSIAIDGPGGAGKSTYARMISQHYGIVYVDTGAIYRTVGLHALRMGVDPKDAAGVIALLDGLEIDLEYKDGEQHMYLNALDVSSFIRLPDVSTAASDVSAIPEVREFLLEMQRDFARRYSVVMDGRDIGTVVLPDADLKIFLTADESVRAQRRYDELRIKGVATEYETVLLALRSRDRNDSSRAVAPLRPADDAVIIDTTELGLMESFELIKSVIAERLGI